MRRLLVVFVLVYSVSLPIAVSQSAADTGTIDYDREPLQRLTQFRQQHRKTIDGRLCAAAFVQDDQTFTDCTDTRSPDGATGREWCYVELQMLNKVEGLKNWNWCMEVVDYDAVRAKAKEAFEAKANEVEKMFNRLDAERARLEDMLARYNATCGKQHDAVRERISKIETLLAKGEHCVKKIEESTSKIELLKATITSTKEQMELEMEKVVKQPQNCEGQRGYEDLPFPDGLSGAYYSNPYFKGVPVLRTDPLINFQWTGKNPVEKVPLQGFSVRWDGYVEAPETGKYIFIVEADSGARLFLNNAPILVDRMPVPNAEEALIEGSVPLLPPSSHDGPKKVESAKVDMIGGDKYKIRLEMIHSNHLRFNNPDTASISLSWRSDGIAETVIPLDYLYRSHPKPPLKISGLDPNNFEISFLYDGEFAYKGSSTHFLADVPSKYEGRKMIRSTLAPGAAKITFTINMPVTLFVASPEETAMPLGSCEKSPINWHETDDLLSVYESESAKKRAVGSQTFKVHYAHLRFSGEVDLPILRKGVPFVAFAQPLKEANNACGGEMQIVSLPQGPFFQTCEASSAKGPEFDCQYGLNGKHSDRKFGTWRSTGGNGIGQFVKVTFKSPVQLTEFRFRPLDDPVQWPAEIALTFGEGEEGDNTQAFTILHTTNLMHLTYKLKPVITRVVRAEVTRMYISGEDTGGSFEFLGTPCTEDEETAPPSTESTAPTQDVSVAECVDTVENIPDIGPVETGRKVTLTCPVKCLSFDAITNISPVFGSADGYAPESAVCSAAMHGGICQVGAEQPCSFMLTVNNGRESFGPSLQNGIASKAHGPSLASFTVHKPGKPLAEKKLNLGFAFRANDVGDPPQGFLVDDGAPFSERGEGKKVSFGWQHQATAIHCPAGAKLNPLNLGGVEFAQDNTWTVTMPENAKYLLEVQLGNPCEPNGGTLRYDLQANGSPIADGQQLKKGQFYWASAEINVQDQKIELTSKCGGTLQGTEEGNAMCKNSRTTIMAMRIRKA